MRLAESFVEYPDQKGGHLSRQRLHATCSKMVGQQGKEAMSDQREPGGDRFVRMKEFDLQHRSCKASSNINPRRLNGREVDRCRRVEQLSPEPARMIDKAGRPIACISLV